MLGNNPIIQFSTSLACGFWKLIYAMYNVERYSPQARLVENF